MNDYRNPSIPSRRGFLQMGGALAAAVAGQALTTPLTPRAPSSAASSPQRRRPSSIPPRRAPCRRATWARPGSRSASSAWAASPCSSAPATMRRAIPVIERALDLGVNYIDTSSIYGGPERWSEQYIGQVMKRRRREAFLASKTKERTRDGSLRMLEKSLELLQTDHLDCWQLHDLGTMGDIDEVFAKGGAMEALIQAQGTGGREAPRHHGPLPSRLPDRGHSPLSVRHGAAGRQRRGAVPLQLRGDADSPGRREADGHHRHEAHGPQAHPVELRSAAGRSPEAVLGGQRRRRHEPRHAEHARGHVLRADAADQHGDRRRRQRGPAGRERPPGPRFHAPERRADGSHRRQGRDLSPGRRCSTSSSTGTDPLYSAYGRVGRKRIRRGSQRGKARFAEKDNPFFSFLCVPLYFSLRTSATVFLSRLCQTIIASPDPRTGFRVRGCRRRRDRRFSGLRRCAARGPTGVGHR